MEKKLIIANRSALKDKYGTAGLKKIWEALEKMVEADKKRKLSTLICEVDNKEAMESAGGKPASSPSSPKSNKDAVDVLCIEHSPAYVMILGGPDVIPHQPLHNPLAAISDDPDPDVPSDLPYACDKPYSRNVEDFIAPTRVVGRLPDIAGGKNAAYLVKLIEITAGWTRRSASTYRKFFAISTDNWKKSTAESLKKTFGSSTGLKLSPDDGPKWTKTAMGRKSHFVNCHGDFEDPTFYGDDGEGDQPDAHLSAEVTKLAVADTVVAAECCYGAELYDPDFGGETIDQPICNAYLEAGALAYVGSTNIAYGPPEGNDEADLVCQYFFREMLKGASTGRAFLQSRHDFVRQSAPLTPYHFKTLGQFILLGDPSVHPVSAPKAAPKARLLSKAVKGDRRLRRRLLRRNGRTLGQTTAMALGNPKVLGAKLAQSLIDKASSVEGFSISRASSIEFKAPVAAGKAAGLKRARGDGSCIVLVHEEAKKVAGTRSKKSRQARSEYIQSTRVLITKIFDGTMESQVEIRPR